MSRQYVGKSYSQEYLINIIMIIIADVVLQWSTSPNWLAEMYLRDGTKHLQRLLGLTGTHLFHNPGSAIAFITPAYMKQ